MTRRLWFNVVTLISLVPCAVVLPGYFGRFGIDVRVVQRAFGPKPVPRQQWVIGDGRFAVWTYAANPGRINGMALGAFAEPHLPHWDHHAVDGFDAHAFPGPATVGAVAYLFAFPLWCVVLPCLVAPLVWVRGYRRRRRSGLPQGFPLDEDIRTRSGSPPVGSRSL